MSVRRLRLAAAQYPIEKLASWDTFAQKLTDWIGEASGAGAELALLPEYFSIEITATLGAAVYSSLPRQLEALQDTLPAFLSLCSDLAADKALYLCAGSYPVLDGGRYRNRSFLFWPERERWAYQDKLQMTRFESERWDVTSGAGLRLFETDFGRVATLICYDIEFPLLARRQVEQGAEILLVPSCTDTLAGFHRVRTGCLARALENQCYVVQAPTVGESPWSEAVDVNVGQAAVYAPSDIGFPADGVLTAGRLNEPGWVYCDLEPERIAAVRAGGQVFNHRDWDGQQRFL